LIEGGGAPGLYTIEEVAGRRQQSLRRRLADGRKPGGFPSLDAAGHVGGVVDAALEAAGDRRRRPLSGAAMKHDPAAFGRRQGGGSKVDSGNASAPAMRSAANSGGSRTSMSTQARSRIRSRTAAGERSCRLGVVMIVCLSGG